MRVPLTATVRPTFIPRITTHLIVLGVTALGIAACDGSPRAAEDELLLEAIAAGEWPAARAASAPGYDPYDTPPTAWIEALGAYRYDAHLVMRYDGALGEESRVDETVRLEQGRDGRYRLTTTRRFQRKGDPEGRTGREAIFDGERFYTRTGNGQWMVRDLLRKDHLDWLHSATRHLRVLTKLVKPGLAERRQGRTIHLSLGQWRKPALPDGVSLREAHRSEGDNWYVWWGRTHRATELRGHVRLHPKQDVVLSTDLSFTVRTRKKARPQRVLSGPELAAPSGLFGPSADDPLAGPSEEAEPPAPTAERLEARFRAELTLRVTRLERPPSTAAPEDVHDPRRPRTQHMIETLLDQGQP